MIICANTRTLSCEVKSLQCIAHLSWNTQPAPVHKECLVNLLARMQTLGSLTNSYLTRWIYTSVHLHPRNSHLITISFATIDRRVLMKEVSSFCKYSKHILPAHLITGAYTRRGYCIRSLQRNTLPPELHWKGKSWTYGCIRVLSLPQSPLLQRTEAFLWILSNMMRSVLSIIGRHRV